MLHDKFDKFAGIDPMDIEFLLRYMRSKDNKTEYEYCLQSKRQSSYNNCKLVSVTDDKLIIEQLENKYGSIQQKYQDICNKYDQLCKEYEILNDKYVYLNDKYHSKISLDYSIDNVIESMHQNEMNTAQYHKIMKTVPPIS